MKKTLEGVENSEELKKNISRLGSKAVVPYWLMSRNKTEAKYDTPAYYNEQRQWLDALLADLKKGRIDKYPWMNDLFREKEWELLNDWKLLVLKEMWQLLEFTIQRLEAISYKQLKHINLNEDENEFLGMYGVIIAGIMQYDPPASLRPRDDAMRVADVYANLSDGGYLHAGIARPRKLYVLYPWEGQTILCIGAVLPYYEFVNSSRLNDELWKKMLDSDKRPSIPEWAAPIVTEGHLGKPEYEKHP